jgi:hypothetical protein
LNEKIFAKNVAFLPSSYIGFDGTGDFPVPSLTKALQDSYFSSQLMSKIVEQMDLFDEQGNFASC